MADIQITQQEADRLLKIDKYRLDNTNHRFPEQGGGLKIPLKSKNVEEDFILDIRRYHIELKKNTFQFRVRKVIILARLDLGGALHRNPDGTEIPCPHIHLYKEGYDDKWAHPLPKDFTDPSNILLSLDEFMKYCNIVEKPLINRLL